MNGNKYVQISLDGQSNTATIEAILCVSFLCRLRGLMFRRGLPEDKSLVIVQRQGSKLSAAIHMFFMFFEIGVLWINQDNKIVDMKLAKPWRIYFPRTSATYIVEGAPTILDSFHVGDRVKINA